MSLLYYALAIAGPAVFMLWLFYHRKKETPFF